MPAVRLHRSWRALTAMTVVALQAWLLVHLGVVTHTVGADGELVELHGDSPVHEHEGPSLCAGGAPEASWYDAGPCEGPLEFVTGDDSALSSAPRNTGGAVAPPPTRLLSRAWRLWRLAPKASPPAA
ncbi:MAG: hypothetical protein SFW67_00390 [Myxococcaceae bacterium]|nr:hypothetical protein [Myxococcaceae bacterium]